MNLRPITSSRRLPFAALCATAFAVPAIAAPPADNTERLVDTLHRAAPALDRKVLSDMAVNDPAAFAKLAEVAKAAQSA